jgi:DNA-binding MarR family transcriptional regulator
MKGRDIQEAASEIRVLAGMVVKAARRDMERRLAEAGVEISGLQYGVLLVLNERGHTLSELSRLMAREPATLLPAVDTLDKEGLVKRGRDSRDRRRTPLLITSLGKSVLKRVPPVSAHDLLPKALKELGEENASKLLSLLREVTLLLPEGKHHPSKEE